MGQLSRILRNGLHGDKPMLTFWCPGCDEAHMVTHGPGGWGWNGDIDRPTFTPSIKVEGMKAVHDAQGQWTGEFVRDASGNPVPFVCHSFVVDGNWQFLGDCTHALAGQTVPIPDWPLAPTMSIPCFFLTPTEFCRISLRRYRSRNGEEPCTQSGLGYHDAEVVLGVVKEDKIPERSGKEGATPRDDPRWPTRCKCGYEFVADDAWQTNNHTLYRRGDNGHLITLRNAPVGAMWFATWFEDVPDFCGHDGHALHVRLPGNHDWNVDGRASNCTMPDDKVHRCWVRHGTPPGDVVHVDKNGNTCAAGAGSILVPGYHGFLHNGFLTDC